MVQTRSKIEISLILISVTFATYSVFSAEETKEQNTTTTSIESLRNYNNLIGGWRGIGQPKRSSQQGAWQEKATAVWELKPNVVGIRWNVDAGQLWKNGLLSHDVKTKRFVLKATMQDDSIREYQGELHENRLILETASNEESNEIHRLTLSVLNENRLTMLFEKRSGQQSFYSRVAEIGYQREGTRLAATSGSRPICVVTGGQGTIAVMHAGKTYYVCCTGCRDAFNDDPGGILADYERRKSEPRK